MQNSQTIHPQISVVHKRQQTEVQSLFESSFFVFKHVDWFEPNDWIKDPGFVMAQLDGDWVGCLAITPEPLPAAWVRAAAIKRLGVSRRPSYAILEQMCQHIWPHLKERGVETVAWMGHRQWTLQWIPQLGFNQIHTIRTYAKENWDIPNLPPTTHLTFRPVLPEDMRYLTSMEARVYQPIWRHSTRALHRAWRQSISFDVALIDGKIAGFQHSTRTHYPDGRKGAHLARITVDPDFQGYGVGSNLLAYAIQGYQRAGIDTMSLNTQTDNEVSQRLYAKFGFQSTGFEVPLWGLELDTVL